MKSPAQRCAFLIIQLAIATLLTACGSGGSSGGPATGLSLTGAVTTFAGQAGVNGSGNGTGTGATFSYTTALTTDGTNLYVADTDNDTIRKIVIATGVVTTFAGQAGVTGHADGTGTGATFSAPTGITTDGTNLYVADAHNDTIRQIVIASGVVTTLAGQEGLAGHTDGTGNGATFNTPQGVTTDGTSVYVADTDNHSIRKIDIATGAVTTLAGSWGFIGHIDGTGTNAYFWYPDAMVIDGSNLYVVDGGNHNIRKIEIATGVVTTFAGQAPNPGSTDGTGTAAMFNNPSSITSDGTNFYLADGGNDTIRKIVIASAVVTTLAGQAGVAGHADGTGTAATFNFPLGITSDGTSLYVADSNNFDIRVIH